MKKYKFTKETIEIDGHTLHRIKAVRSFSDVHRGDLGGFIESEENLSQLGESWVGGNARVSGNAQVSEDARVDSDASVDGNARVYQNAYIAGNVSVSDHAHICGYARICGNAKVFGNASIYGGYVRISDNAIISGDTTICGDSTHICDNTVVNGHALISGDNVHIYGDAHVFGDVTVFANANIAGKAEIYDNRHILIIGPLRRGCGREFLTFFRDADRDISVVSEDFSREIDKIDIFEEKVNETHEDFQYREVCKAAIELAKTHIDILTIEDKLLLLHLQANQSKEDRISQ